MFVYPFAVFLLKFEDANVDVESQFSKQIAPPSEYA